MSKEETETGFHHLIPAEVIDAFADAPTERDKRETARVTHFGDACTFTGVTSDSRRDWHDMRRKLLTASAMAALLGQDPWSDAYDVYVDKTSPIPRAEPTIEDGGIFWGNVLEQPVLTTVANAYGWDYQRGGALLRSLKHPIFGATLDAEIDRHDGIGWIPNEGKTTTLVGQWDEKSGELPSRVLIQAQHQLLVTGAPLCLVVALLAGNRHCMIKVEPSEDFFAMIIDEGSEFMARVQRGECPTPTHRSNVKGRWPRDDGSMITLPIEFLQITQDIFEKQAQIKTLEDEIEGLKNQIRHALGEATFGALLTAVGGKALWRWAVEGKGGRVLRTMVDFPKGHAIHDTRRLETLARMPALTATVHPEQSAVVAQRFRKGRQRTR